MAAVLTTDSYSESHKLALYYQELQANNPAWRPSCPECRTARRGTKLMIKNVGGGFYCVCCKFAINYSMKKVEHHDTQTVSPTVPGTNVPTSRAYPGD